MPTMHADDLGAPSPLNQVSEGYLFTVVQVAGYWARCCTRLRPGEYGVAAVCNGGRDAIATVVQRVEIPK
jgi:hypothetical protein